MRRHILIVAALALPFPSLADAKGIGLEDVVVDGVVSQDGRYRYVALQDDPNTTLLKIATSGGRVVASRSPGGWLLVPAVAADATAGGLSADGRTLVLSTPFASNPTRTPLRIIDTGKLATRRAIDLPGVFGVDAISPDGSRIYLIEYLDPPATTRYRVRSLETATGRLHPDPIVDADEPDEQMTGMALTRATSPDGRWAYTLYGRTDGAPFIHALDSQQGVAHCIDLPIAPIDPYLAVREGLSLSVAGNTLVAARSGVVVARVDLIDFIVESADRTTDSSATTVAVAGSGAAVLLAGATWWLRRRRTT